MKKYLINFVILLMLSLNVVSASEKDYGKLTEIALQEGLNEFQKEAVNTSGFIENLKAFTDRERRKLLFTSNFTRLLVMWICHPCFHQGII